MYGGLHRQHLKLRLVSPSLDRDHVLTYSFPMPNQVRCMDPSPY